MTAIQWRTERSDGSETLASSLQIAIWDYVRAFGRSPRLIQIPYFRQIEMDPGMFNAMSWKDATFRGIPFRFNVCLDLIELS